MKNKVRIFRSSNPTAEEKRNYKIYQSYGRGIKTKFSTTSFLKILDEVYKIAPKKCTKLNRSLEVRWVRSPEMKALNKQFRKKNKPTDVLSFEADHKDLLGSIIIDIDTAKNQASEFNHSPLREIKELFVHGVFHLLGFDHQTRKESNLMKRYERRLEKFIDHLDHPRR